MVTPAGCDPPNRNVEPCTRYFLQYAGLPAEYSASFALERFRCFSRIVNAFPVIEPFSSSKIIIWNSSNLEPLDAANSDVEGLSAIESHSIFEVDDRLISWSSNQSTTESTDSASFPSALMLPSLVKL